MSKTSARLAQLTVVALLLAALLPAAHGQGDQISTSEQTSDVRISRGGFKYVRPICRPVDSDTQATFYCKLFWQVIFAQSNSAGASALRLSAFGTASVELVGGVLAPKAGAVPVDSWTSSFNPEWNSGKGVPAERTIRAAVPAGTFPKLDTPFHLFAKVDAGTSDAELPVSIWIGTVAKHAFMGPSAGGLLKRTLSAASKAPQYLDTVCGPSVSYAGAVEACNRVEVSVKLAGGAPALGAGVQLKVTLYPDSEVERKNGTVSPKPGAEGGSKTAAVGADGSWRQFAGQSLPGETPVGEDATAPAPLHAFLEYVGDLPADVPVEVRVASIATYPTAGRFESTELAFARRTNPTGRSFPQNISAGGYGGVPPWLVIVLLFVLVSALTAIAVAIIYCCKARRRRERLEKGGAAESFGGYGDEEGYGRGGGYGGGEAVGGHRAELRSQHAPRAAAPGAPEYVYTA
eukprot:tig00020960_g16587.t1